MKFIAPVLFVKDIEVAKKFYLTCMEQEIEHDFGKNITFKSNLSLWQLNSEHEVAVVEGSNSTGNTHEIYFETEDIQASITQVKQAGVKFLHEIITEPWGQQTFRFFDPDGHLIEVGEGFDTFIIRIYRETESVQRTAEKTGVPEKK